MSAPDKSLITAVEVFDVYVGPGVAEGAKSVGVQVTLQPHEATITDAEIEAVSAKVVAAAQKLGAHLRG